VLLLSDVDGLYDRDPRDPAAQHIPSVDNIDGRIRVMVASTAGSTMGSGGMASKLDAAEIATRAGIGLTIASGLRDLPLAALATDAPATWFAPREGASARKIWIGGRLSVKGRIKVDAGAAKALRGGASLLPAGAREVSGDFRRGDVVEIIHPNGEALARGLSEYDAADAALICGKKSAELEAILGAVPRQVLVHRDQMVML
jgi:glutamate 5-kinase